MLAWSTSKLVKYPRRNSYLIIAILGGMKVGEGITRFCPLTALFNQYQERSQTSEDEQLSMEINPS
jgi:hypothetical protein